MSIATDVGNNFADYGRPLKSTKSRRRSVVAFLAGFRPRAASRRMAVAVVGLGYSCNQIVWQCLQQSEQGLDVVGVFGESSEKQEHGYCLGCAIGGNLEDLLVLAQNRQIDAVILAIPAAAERRIQNVVARLRQIAVDVYLHDEDARADARPSHAALSGLPLASIERRPLSNSAVFLKAAEDRLLAAGILLAISPLLLVIAALIKLDSPGPAIFRQKRYGLNNKLIEIFKFRTLHVGQSDTNAEQLVTRNDSRVTRIGAFLRRTSLDELPQFLNVLRGDMSVVGPRPHALSAKAGVLQYDEIVDEYAARHRVKPGITGWAQINGWRGETTTAEHIEQRVAHDFFYIANWSLLLDLKIVLKTVTGGFSGRQAY